MKKILVLFLAICMLISAFPAVISAEAINEKPDSAPTTYTAPVADPSNYTVYVSNEGDDANAGTEAAPVKTIEGAYAKLANSTTIDANICVLSNVVIFNTGAKIKYLGMYSGTVYIYGVKTDDVYPNIDLNFNNSSELLFRSDTVIYDVCLVNGSNKTIILSAHCHDLTLGENVTCTSDTLYIIGTSWFDSKHASCGEHDVSENSAEKPLEINCAISIYSDSLNIKGLYACYRGSLTGTYVSYISGTITLNIYDGNILNIYDVPAEKTGLAERIDDMVLNINLFGLKEDGSCKVTSVYGGAAVGADVNLTYANGLSVTTDGTFSSKTVIKANDRALYCGVQNTQNVSPYSIRFIGVTDSVEYDEIGFKIAGSNGKKYDTACTKLYTSVVGDGDDYTAEALGGEFIFAAAIRNIPTDAGEVTFTVKPYVVKDGVTYYGTAYTVTYNSGAYVSSAVAN